MPRGIEPELVSLGVNFYHQTEPVEVVSIGRRGDPPQRIERSELDAAYLALVDAGFPPKELVLGDLGQMKQELAKQIARVIDQQR
jgi:hypothetical protein